MQIDSSKDRDVVVMRLDGRLDVLTAKQLESELLTQIAGGEKRIVLDFEKVEYVSSTGLRVLLEGRKALRPKGGVLVLSSLPAFVENVLKTAGFDNIFPFFATSREAVDSMSA
jgi:anti-sigma B factor antagonist